MTANLPPRKPVTAWETDIEFDWDGPFGVLTFHHGLGKMTRLDLTAEDMTEVANLLLQTAAEIREDQQ